MCTRVILYKDSWVYWICVQITLLFWFVCVERGCSNSNITYIVFLQSRLKLNEFRTRNIQFQLCLVCYLALAVSFVHGPVGVNSLLEINYFIAFHIYRWSHSPTSVWRDFFQGFRKVALCGMEMRFYWPGHLHRQDCEGHFNCPWPDNSHTPWTWPLDPWAGRDKHWTEPSSENILNFNTQKEACRLLFSL